MLSFHTCKNIYPYRYQGNPQDPIDHHSAKPDKISSTDEAYTYTQYLIVND